MKRQKEREQSNGSAQAKEQVDGAANHAGEENDHKPEVVLYQRFTCSCPRYNPDSGCSDHLRKDNKTMSNLVPTSQRIMTAKDCAMIASQMGDVEAVSSSGLTMQLEKVLHLPQLSENLLSISKMAN